ncbi:ribokinase [Curtobacterium luteum]|uniref:Ribokinase n=1 Tax=Curtobacterium luteum TaxID=33881 RepID=A0A175S3M5_9MICO|nr:ribokinase [Curtobacterium luteum]KTR10759.1 hypothetical protein NS184_01350 [Curtobacterium luteum]
MAGRDVLVVGSVNYDYIVTQDRLPRRGETFVATDAEGAFGGKGANQAVQAARLGARVRFIGATGADSLGQMCLDNLRNQGVDCHMRPTGQPNGLGIVHVVGEGDVYATIVEGANGTVDPDWIDENEQLFHDAGVVVIQNEIPAEANERAVDLAVAAAVPVVFNAAPARPVAESVTRRCAWLVVNEDEASAYLGRELGDVRDDTAMRRAVVDLQLLCSGVVLTLGSRGCYVADGPHLRFVEAVPTHAVDSTGAGDSFIGAFANALVDGSDPFAAAVDATRVASITVEGVGAQSSMPTREVLTSEVL